MIFHIADPKEYNSAVDSGAAEYRPASFEREGFIHCSEASQVASTLHRHFAMADSLVIVAIDAEAEHEYLRYEDLYKRGQLFPHLYHALPLSSVRGTHALERRGGVFVIPFEWMRSFG